MFISKEELNTHLNEEQFEAISGDDDTIITAAIDGAVAEAKGYLSKYNTEAIFNGDGSNRNALLIIFIKDISVWHYINLTNPGIELKLRQDRYNAAIAWLKGVQRGEIVPDLPLAESTENSTSGYAWGSNSRRESHF